MTRQKLAVLSQSWESLPVAYAKRCKSVPIWFLLRHRTWQARFNCLLGCGIPRNTVQPFRRYHKGRNGTNSCLKCYSFPMDFQLGVATARSQDLNQKLASGSGLPASTCLVPGHLQPSPVPASTADKPCTSQFET